jgi:hypothetical protein
MLGVLKKCTSFVWVLLMESINHYTVRMQFSRLPLRWIIPDLLNTVLYLVAVDLGVQNGFDKILVFTIDLN